MDCVGAAKYFSVGGYNLKGTADDGSVFKLTNEEPRKKSFRGCLEIKFGMV